MTTTITLTPPAAFINSNERLHYHEKATRTRAWRAAAKAAVESTFEPYFYRRARIKVLIRFATNHRRDVGNYYPTAKAIVDGLVDAGLMPDDNDRHLIGPDMRRHIPNGSPLVTVTIQEIS
jgi:hypothetical protein